jgi:enoyl-CoA hydratase/carnithine racemase
MTIANPVTLPLSGYTAQHVHLSVEGAVATITLNRPERKNPLTFESYAELGNMFRAAARDKSVKAIVITGAGAIVAMASDIRIGTANAKVAFLFNRVGLGGCDMGACAILPRIIGQGRAAELLFTGRSLAGQDAERWGFFNRLAPPASVLAEAQALAAELAAGPTFGNAMTKRMLEMEWAMSVETAIEAEAVAQALCMETEDFARAFRAFADKRKPVFEGN